MLQPITKLSSTGEVAQFVDDDQFVWGVESTMKCGPSAVSQFWHSTAPGTANPYKSEDLHKMASSDYQRFIGPDVPSDLGGTSDALLYQLLGFHNFHCVAFMNRDRLKGWLNYGYPVICGIVEGSVHDRTLARCPYPWDVTGKTHIILCTGLGDGPWLRFRDTANVENNGNPNILRPGPREYDINLAQFTSMTMVVPSWLPVPPAGFDPTQVPTSSMVSVDRGVLVSIRDELNKLLG